MNTSREIHPDDMCQMDGPWSYFVVSPERSIDAFAYTVAAQQSACGHQSVVRVLRGRRCNSPKSTLQEWASALQFPYYFGHNWDAFDECIADLAWLPASCYVFFVTDLDLVLSIFPRDFAILIDALEKASHLWKVPNRENTDEPIAPFTVVFHAELDSAEEALERLRATGTDPVVSRFSKEFLELAAEPPLHYRDPAS